MADALDIEMPELPDDDGTTKMSIISANGSNIFSDDRDTVENGIWEDEDARSFYEKLADLKVLVPGVLLETTGKKESGKDGKSGTEGSVEADTETPKATETSTGSPEVDGDSKDDELIARLQQLGITTIDNDENEASAEGEAEADGEQDSEANATANDVAE
jgi:regulator of nonsense transcripts 2